MVLRDLLVIFTLNNYVITFSFHPILVDGHLVFFVLSTSFGSVQGILVWILNSKEPTSLYTRVERTWHLKKGERGGRRGKKRGKRKKEGETEEKKGKRYKERKMKKADENRKMTL